MMHLEVTHPVCGRCGCAYRMEPVWHGAEGVVIEGTVDEWRDQIVDDWFGRDRTRRTAVECCGVFAVVQFYRRVR